MLSEVLNIIKELYSKEPAVINGAIASAVVFVLALTGIVIPQTDVLTAVAYIVPIIVGAIATRSRVSPK